MTTPSRPRVHPAAPVLRARRASTSRLAPGVVLGAAALLACAPAAQAVEIPPGVTVVDEAGVLTQAEESELSSAITQLRRETGQNLYVVYVDAFETNSQGLVQDVVDQRGLGSNDSVLAIAVETRNYGFDMGQRFSGEDLQQDVIDAYIGPVLPAPGEDRWFEPALAAVHGIDDAADGTLDGVGVSGAGLDPAGALPGGSAGGGSRGGSEAASGSDVGSGLVTGLIAAGGLGAAGWLGYSAYQRRRKGGSGSAEGRAGEGGSTPAAPRDPLDEMPLDKLHVKAGSMLVGADDAIRTSEQELGFAEASYGPEAVTTFREDIAQAKDHMRESFRLQQLMEDEIPDTEADQRSWLKEIIGRCEKVQAALSAHQEDFNELRDMEKNVPQTLESIDAALPGARERVAATEARLASLHGEYAPGALEEVADNAEQARDRLEFVEAAEAKAREAWDASDAATAALAVRAAERGLSQVDTLVAAVDKSQKALADTMGYLKQGMAQSEQDLAEAEAIAGQSRNSDLAGPIAGLRTVMDSVRRELAGGRVNPTELLHRLEEAHRQLNVPLAGVRDARVHARQAAQQLPAAQRQAQADIEGTMDFISVRRGAVGSVARSRLAEAERLLQQSRQLGSSDPAQALAAAQEASLAAEDASTRARRDVSVFDLQGGGYDNEFHPAGYRRVRRSNDFGSGFGGALLGGLIFNSLLGGGGGGGGGGDWGGGFGGGGGDFGGFGDIGGGSF